ncbi:MAG: hypothetical protein JRE29_12095 [Deltaproteobacteria bacterium]|nr:hypothetical protein [Deltaproteobacteria bacterium]
MTLFHIPIAKSHEFEIIVGIFVQIAARLPLRRKEESLTTSLALIFFMALSCSVVINIARGYPPMLASNILEILFMTASGVYGGIIYRLQLAGIQHL